MIISMGLVKGNVERGIAQDCETVILWGTNKFEGEVLWPKLSIFKKIDVKMKKLLFSVRLQKDIDLAKPKSGAPDVGQ